MKKNTLFYLLIIIVLTLILNLGAVYAYRLRNMQSYLAAGIDKEQRLRLTAGERIVLVGGSNVAFGFRSDLIEKITGMPTINMGLQGSLGIRFSLNSLKPLLRQGDIVIISPEYNNFTNGFIGGDILAQYLILNPSDIRYVTSLDEFAGIISVFPYTHTDSIHSVLDNLAKHDCFLCPNNETVYFRQAFNQFGDITVNQNNGDVNNEPLILTLGNEHGNTEQTIKDLNQFASFADGHEISVYLVFPPTSIIDDPKTTDFINKLEKKLHQELNFPILGSISESEFGDEYMFNTYYHLNSTGAELHTHQMLNWLCAKDSKIQCDE